MVVGAVGQIRETHPEGIDGDAPTAPAASNPQVQIPAARPPGQLLGEGSIPPVPDITPRGVGALRDDFVISNRYDSRTRTRRDRQSTQFIVLHTTEGGSSGISGISRQGSAHYTIDLDGHVYRTLPRSKVAYHAGRSMWDGVDNLNEHSMGIEVVGFSTHPMTAQQELALRELLKQLRALYDVPSDRILPHAMVAYSKNHWHNFKPARGRKKDGLQFSDDRVRARLGLGPTPRIDPDLKAARVIVGDRQLYSFLFDATIVGAPAAYQDSPDSGNNIIGPDRTAWNIAHEAYDAPTTWYEFPDGSIRPGHEMQGWDSIPAGTKVTFESAASFAARLHFLEIGKDVETAWSAAGRDHNSETTLYFLPDGRIRQGNELDTATMGSLPQGTRILVDYVFGGKITADRSPVSIAGWDWDAPETFYLYPDGETVSGSDVEPTELPVNTIILFRSWSFKRRQQESSVSDR